MHIQRIIRTVSFVAIFACAMMMSGPLAAEQGEGNCVEGANKSCGAAGTPNCVQATNDCATEGYKAQCIAGESGQPGICRCGCTS